MNRLKWLSMLVFFTIISCKNSKDNQTAVPIPEPEVLETKIEEQQKEDDFVEIEAIETRVYIDIRYATENNFVGEKMYDCGKCYLRRSVAEKLNQFILDVNDQGYAVKMFDCYRPRPIQQKLWDKVPNPNYVTPPKKGSMHNRGQAVDLTICDRTGKNLDMGTTYDYFGEKAHHSYTKHSDAIQKNRDLLKNTIEKYDFKGIRTEWWHYAVEQPSYGISDWEWECL